MSQTTEQARLIFDTVRTMQRRVLRRADLACQESGPWLELTPPQANACALVFRRGQASIKELAGDMDVSPPSASAMVDRLVELGAVTREPSKSDRREVVIQLTPAGLRTIAHLQELMLDSIGQLLESIGPAHADMWCQVCQRITEVLESDEQEPQLHKEHSA